MYTMKDFIGRKIAVTFKNREERLKFLKMCEEKGIRWNSGDLATKFDPGDGTAVIFGLNGRDTITYGRSLRKDRKVIPFSEFECEETIGVIKRNGNTITVHMGDLRGTAKCSPDDQFDLYTGCELALRRALGKEDIEAPVYPEKFESGKRYKVSIRAYRRNKVIPAWMSDNEGKEVNVVSPDIATCGSFDYSPSWCEEIKEPEKHTDPEKPKYYNGKMVCVENGGYYWWTVGKIYEYKDGIVTADDGDQYPRRGEEPYLDADDAKHPGCICRGRHNHCVTMLEIKE